MNISAVMHMLLKPALLLALTLPLASHAAGNPEMKGEIERFIKAYRVAEAGSLMMKLSLQTAASQGRARKEFIDCITKKLTPQSFEAIAFEAADNEFSNIENLRELNQFLESGAGRKVTDQAMGWLEREFQRVMAGHPPRQMAPAAYTAQEVRAIQAFEKSPANADFKRFVEIGIPNLSKNGKIPQIIGQYKRECESPVKAAE